MTDSETAKKVVQDVFVKKVGAKTKEEIEQRLFVAHTLINTVFVENTQEKGLAEQWYSQFEDIEERINELRNRIAQAK